MIHSRRLISDNFYVFRLEEIVLARFEDEFYRGICLSKKGEKKFEIQYIDYGNMETVSIKDIRKLPTILALPICAHSCVVRSKKICFKFRVFHKLREHAM